MTAKTTIPAEQSMRLISFKKKWGDLRLEPTLRTAIGVGRALARRKRSDRPQALPLIDGVAAFIAGSIIERRGRFASGRHGANVRSCPPQSRFRFIAPVHPPQTVRQGSTLWNGQCGERPIEGGVAGNGRRQRFFASRRTRKADLNLS